MLLISVARKPALVQGVDLVLHEGDQRADDQRDPGQKQGGQLVAEALAAAGRHHAEDVAAVQHLLDDLALAGAELLQAELIAERPLQVDSAAGKTHGPGSLETSVVASVSL